MWTPEEVILVLSLYFEEGKALHANHPKVLELSCVMSALPVNVGGDHAGTVRKPGAVAMKLANFAHAENPGGGLSNVGPRDRRFFDAYKDRRDDCAKVAQDIRRTATSSD